MLFIHSLSYGAPSTTGCLYGDGYIKIFAGDSAEDESALLAFESAEFESELQIVSHTMLLWVANIGKWQC